MTANGCWRPAATITTPSRSTCPGCWRRSKPSSPAGEEGVERRPPVVNAATANERLAQALVAFLRQEFGSSVAAILGFIDILIEDARGNDLDDLVPDLDRMQAAGLQLSAMIGRILDMPGHLGAALLYSGEDGDTYRSRLRHDLRTPLSAIKGYGELLVEEAYESGRDTLVADLTKVLGLTERLLGEIDKLVEF